MKPDTERTKRYYSQLHTRASYVRSHVSKTLGQKLKQKKRSLRLHKGDTVQVMRGFAKGRQGKVAEVNYVRSKAYIEGITQKTSRGKEVLMAFEPSNLLLLELEPTKERQAVLGVVSKPAAAVKAPKVSKDVKAATEPGLASTITGQKE